MAALAGLRLYFRSHSTAAAPVMSLLRFENDPVRILSICRDAALSPTVHPDRAALSLAVSALSAAGSSDSVRSLIGDLLSSSTASANGGDSHVRSHAIVLFGQAGMLADAIRTFKESKSAPSLRSLNALLFACILSKNHAEAPKIFKDFTNSYGINPNLDTYNTLIKAFCESGSSRRFFAVLDDMVRVKIKPNLTTFCISLAGFYREGLFDDDVRKVLRLMKKHGCHANLSIYNVRIQSLCKLKRSIEAKDLLKEMLKRGRKPNWVTYDHLILGFCNEGDLEEAKKLYMEMMSKGLMPERSCYSSLIYYLCKGGDFETALQLARDSMDRNITPQSSIMKSLVNGLVNVSKVDDARDLIAKLKDRYPGRADMWKEVEESMP